MPPEQSASWPSVAHPCEQPRAAANSKQKKARPAALPATPSAHRHQGDRGDSGGDDDAALPVYCRFADLKKARIVESWMQLRRMVVDHGFPAGILLSPGVRAWTLTEVKDFLATRPTAPRPVRLPYKNDEQLATEAAAQATTGT